MLLFIVKPSQSTPYGVASSPDGGSFLHLFIQFLFKGR